MDREVVTPEAKKPFGRHRCRWNNNIKMYLKKHGHRQDVEWTHLHRARLGALVNTAMNIGKTTA
jgi:hypothetical protein